MARLDAAAVFLDASDLGPCRFVGTLRPASRAPDSPIGFDYAPEWWSEPAAFRLDPSHYEQTVQPQYPEPGHLLAPVFSDASPDRWGRLLLDYREQDQARAEGRRTRALGEWDYLLGVNDELRMGALRFAAPAAGSPFLDDAPGSVPPLADLRELEHAARIVEDPRRGGSSAIRDALRQLLAPGSPMGGARPKASFRDASGALWFAKFPSHNDRRDMGGWEYVLDRLAGHAGIDVPEVDLRMPSGPYHTFLARRFDREGNGRRMFASAMTMLGKQDREPASYAEIAEAIDLNGAPGHIEEDLAQLFRRLVFNVVTGHRDDHLRNHGFLRTPAGWRLAPAFDLNPMPEMSHHEVAVGLTRNDPDVEVAVSETAPFCRLSPAAARAIVNEVRSAVAGWRSVATEVGLSRLEVEAVSPAFDE
jgi:serine/threonine-protein kinase HipA